MERQQEQPLIGESQAFLEVLEHVSRVAQLNRPVLVIGERGTGKELVAARIHYLGPAFCQTQLRHAGGNPAGNGTLRTRGRLIHRRHPAQAGAL